MPVQNDYKVYITASDRDGIQFQNNASLTFKEKSMSTLIQTDKAIYKPGQLGRYGMRRRRRRRFYFISRLVQSRSLYKKLISRLYYS